ncbi:hypothetical protein [Caldifermentibacillus hisashii]|uniref:hypothetical protein n=1 Tax=Caldifermentibacillus hisashii TaxID=996558 RepID=UPI003D1DA053
MATSLKLIISADFGFVTISHPCNFQAHHRGRKWFLHGRNRMDIKEQNSDIGRSDSKVRKELITKGLIRLWK